MLSFSCNPEEELIEPEVPSSQTEDFFGPFQPPIGPILPPVIEGPILRPVFGIVYLNKTFYIQSGVGDSNRFLQVEGANPNRRAPLNIDAFTAKKEQQFTFEDAGDGYVYIRSNTQSKRALHVNGANKDPEAEVSLWEVVNQDNLKWKLWQDLAGNFYIQSKLGTFLDVQESSSEAKTPVWTNTVGSRRGDLGRIWKLHETNQPITFKKKFIPNMVTELCPTTLLRGDREFAGNGPRIRGSVELVQGRDALRAIIKFNAKETKPDWSEVEGEWVRTILIMPPSWTIDEVLSPHDKTEFDYTITSPSRGYGFNQGDDCQPNSKCISRDGIAEFIHVVGDTGGNDISDNNECSDDTRIKRITFSPLNLQITYRP
ncbi:RICIN domain-containing protein [Tunicatimonas pelagia]|uniref:RICIN domain-containing protein n=1 Tax=Tunicatimonas pelagia TaxID=931531 RepID=UPI002666F540|nr:RICIN domain-containing protein [Tunicatimonas pelagia]WKN42935.1 RICIN domain-containing protein [Tunicatimonas pelagia]